MLRRKKICCGLLQLGGYGETREKGIDLKNPNVKYKDLHTKTTGSQVKHNLYLLLAPPEQGAFQVRDSEATKRGGEGGRGEVAKMVCIIKTQFMMTICTTTHDSLVQLFGLFRFRSYSSNTLSKGGCN